MDFPDTSRSRPWLKVASMEKLPDERTFTVVFANKGYVYDELYEWSPVEVSRPVVRNVVTWVDP